MESRITGVLYRAPTTRPATSRIAPAPTERTLSALELLEELLGADDVVELVLSDVDPDVLVGLPGAVGDAVFWTAERVKDATAKPPLLHACS